MKRLKLIFLFYMHEFENRVAHCVAIPSASHAWLDKLFDKTLTVNIRKIRLSFNKQKYENPTALLKLNVKTSHSKVKKMT